MKKITLVIGTALIIMFGIHAMYQTILPAIVLDNGPSKPLESVSRDASARAIPFVKTVMTVDEVWRAAGTKGTRRCVFPVSLERVLN